MEIEYKMNKELRDTLIPMQYTPEHIIKNFNFIFKLISVTAIVIPIIISILWTLGLVFKSLDGIVVSILNLIIYCIIILIKYATIYVPSTVFRIKAKSFNKISESVILSDTHIHNIFKLEDSDNIIRINSIMYEDIQKIIIDREHEKFILHYKTEADCITSNNNSDYNIDTVSAIAIYSFYLYYYNSEELLTNIIDRSHSIVELI